MFDITFLPATFGDCIWISYGPKDDLKHVLIDGGTGGTREYIIKRLEMLEAIGKGLELVVVTHVDKDHIEGILSIFQNFGGRIKTKDFWFNAWKHLTNEPEFEKFGGVQGEKLSTYLKNAGTPWNSLFSGKGVVVADDGPLPMFTLEGGLKITLLSPYRHHLEALKPVWKKEVEDAGLAPGHVSVQPPKKDWEKLGGRKIPDVAALCKQLFDEDDAPANGSSIGLLAEFEGKKALLTGDAYPSTIIKSLDRIADREGAIDLFKLSHHGSKGNTSPELFARIQAKEYVISTSGASYYHPDEVTIARLITSNPNAKNIHFNYRSKFNEVWDDSGLKKTHAYQTFYSSDGEITISIGR